MGAVAWTLLALLVVSAGGTIAWLIRRVLHLQRRLEQHEADLDKYRVHFHDFLGKKAQELEVQVNAQLELLARNAASKVDGAVQTIQGEMGKMDGEARRLVQEAKQVVVDGAAKVKAELTARLQSHLADFKVLLDNAYLEQYEKMKRTPPRPKKGPRKRAVEPPKRYRSLDDE